MAKNRAIIEKARLLRIIHTVLCCAAPTANPPAKKYWNKEDYWTTHIVFSKKLL